MFMVNFLLLLGFEVLSLTCENVFGLCDVKLDFQFLLCARVMD
jgi:hypothetical protein